MAYVPIIFVLAGMAAYTVLAGADFGAGLWTLLAPGRGAHAKSIRDHARHAMGPVWEANHVWLIFVLVVCWTAYPVAFGSFMSTLAAPMLIAAIGIIFRGTAYALRGIDGSAWFAEGLLGTSSVLTPFALATAVGAIAQGRVPVGNAAGDLVTSWLNPASVLIGLLSVAFSGYLAAVFLAADARRLARTHPDAERPLIAAFRRRAVASGVAAGVLALAGLFMMRSKGLDLTHGPALVFAVISALAGMATMALCLAWRFALARLTAALAVATVVMGWAVAQNPRLLPGLTVTQAAAGQSTLVATVVSICVGLGVLMPSLALLFGLYLKGKLDTPEHHHTEGPHRPVPVSAPEAALASGAMRAGSVPARVLAWGTAAAVGLIGGSWLLVFTDGDGNHFLGIILLALAAISLFTLAAPRPGSD